MDLAAAEAHVPKQFQALLWCPCHPTRGNEQGCMYHMDLYLVGGLIVPADDMGVVRHTQKTQTPMSSAKWKNGKMHKSRVICKVHRKKKHMTWDLCIQKDAKHVMSTNSHTVHFTSHMNKDSILVHDYLLAVGRIQNNTSAVRIFQSHMNPFTSLFYLATT